MLSQIGDLAVAILLLFAAIVHVLRFIYLLFKPRWLAKISWLAASPSRMHLALYYLLVIGVCIFVALKKIKNI
jgi:hypothetical protein